MLGIPLNGYIIRILRGADPAPDVKEWGSLFSDGLKLTVVEFFFVSIMWLFTICSQILGSLLITWNVTLYSGLDPRYRFAIDLLILLLPFIIIGFFLPVAFIRYARNNNYYDLFNVRSLFRDIDKIGRLTYFLAMSLFFIGIVIPLMYFAGVFFVLMIIANFEEGLVILGVTFLILLGITPLITVFTARFLTLLYDSAVEKLP
jgi:hypothetical protein